MTLTYKLNRDVVGRTAAQLNWGLRQIRSSIRITNRNTMINGKSLVGILQAHMRFDDVIVVTIDEDDQIDEIKEQFEEIGREI